MNSRNLSKSSAPDRRNRRKPREKDPVSAGVVTKAAPGTTDLDRPLKLATAQALASAGGYVRINVLLSEPRDVNEAKRVVDVTDVDVMSIGHMIDFRADVSCVSCKGGTSVAVIHETFALAGVMRYLHAQRGYAIFARKPTEGHMIGLAQQLDVVLMDHDEWQHWLKRIAGPYATPRTFDETVDAALAEAIDKRTDLAPFVRYLRSEYWYLRDYRNVQNLVSWIRRVAGQLNTSPLSQYVVLDALSLFSLSLLQLCEFVNASGVLRIRDGVPPYLFGGMATYRSRRDLLSKVEEMLRKKGIIDSAQAMPRLDPQYLPDLMELVLRYCNKPSHAARVPQQLSLMAGYVASEVAGIPHVAVSVLPESPTTEKLAYDLVEMVGRAAALSPDLVRQLLRVPSGAASAPPVQAQLGVPKAAPELDVSQAAGPPGTPSPSESTKNAQARQPDLLSEGAAETAPGGSELSTDKTE